MLVRMRAFFAAHIKAARHSLVIGCRQPFVSSMTVLIIALMLTIPAIFWVFADNIDQVVSKWQSNEQVTLYLKPSLTVADETSLLNQVRTMVGVRDATLKSPAEGLAELSQQEGMLELVQDLAENPLPAVIDVTLAPGVNSLELRQTLLAQMKSSALVDQIKTDLQWTSRLDAIGYFLTVIAKVVMLFLAMAMILIIANTLRQAVLLRHEEIKVLKLIGAADAFIARPFLYSGMLFGLLGAMLAVIFVHVVLISLGNAVHQLVFAYQTHYDVLGLSVYQTLLLIVFAIGLGWIGACLSVKRQLASIEPYC